MAFARSYATMIAEGYAASLQVPHNAFSSNLHRKIENDETEKQEAKVYGITDSGCCSLCEMRSLRRELSQWDYRDDRTGAQDALCGGVHRLRALYGDLSDESAG